MSIPIIWIAYSIFDLSARRAAEKMYLDEFCSNTLDFEALVGDHFPQTFTVYVMHFERGGVIDNTKLAIANDILVNTLVSEQISRMKNRRQITEEQREIIRNDVVAERLSQLKEEDLTDESFEKKWPAVAKLAKVFPWLKSNPHKKNILLPLNIGPESIVIASCGMMPLQSHITALNITCTQHNIAGICH